MRPIDDDQQALATERVHASEEHSRHDAHDPRDREGKPDEALIGSKLFDEDDRDKNRHDAEATFVTEAEAASPRSVRFRHT